MKELGLDGSSLSGLVKAANEDPARVEEALAKLTNDSEGAAKGNGAGARGSKREDAAQ